MRKVETLKKVTHPPVCLSSHHSHSHSAHSLCISAPGRCLQPVVLSTIGPPAPLNTEETPETHEKKSHLSSLHMAQHTVPDAQRLSDVSLLDLWIRASVCVCVCVEISRLCCIFFLHLDLKKCPREETHPAGACRGCYGQLHFKLAGHACSHSLL